MNEKILKIENKDGRFIVNDKIFYSEAAALAYIEAKSQYKAGMSKGTKIFLAIVIGSLLVFLFAISDGFSTNGRYGEAFVKGFLKALFLVPIVTLFFWVSKRVKETSRDQKRRKEAEGPAYEKAFDEIESGNIKRGVWAKALVESDGDEAKARALYIKFRVRDL